MKRRILALVLAGGAGGRLELLTARRAKPAVPFAGTHRLIDFPLSNCANAGLSDVWVSQQFNPVSLSDHLSNGRPWDLDRTRGGLLLLQPHLGNDDRGGFNRGTADTLWRNAPLLRQFAPDVLVVLSADAVYRLDYSSVVDEHLETGADVTMVTTRVDRGDADRYGVVQVADDGRITDYAYKPDDPATDLVTNEVFAFTPGPLLDLLEELATDRDDGDDDGLQDLGHELLPRLVEAGRARERRLDGYWRDVGTIPAYHAAHLDLLGDDPLLDLDDPAWPVLTRDSARRAPARIAPGAQVEDSVLAPTSLVAGTVTRSVLGRGAVVEPGAQVHESVLLPGAVVRRGARVVRSVLDDGVDVGEGASVGGEGADDELTLVGLRARVEPGTVLEAGARHPED